MVQINLNFFINEVVYIKPFDCKGTVYQILITNGLNVEYRIKYYLESKQLMEYFQENELEGIK